ncbi:MAG TPA: MbcA/ParS/Xre antitoxin family protein [Gammaproteobacteria bacterium]|nr:MbcA/ParS/Xre antitoxin family protein [Gammaproteobacteria bacterium]
MPNPAYAVTPDPAPARSGALTPAKVTAAMRAVFRIMEAWGVTTEQARTLLGRPGRSTLFKWKRGEVSTAPYDTVRRISYILGIYKILQIVFAVPEQADAWVQKPNAAFGGRSALEHMLGGDVTDLAAVRAYLDAVRGQGA